MEIWKDVPFNTDYKVSQIGRVVSKSRPIRYVHSVTKQEHYRMSEEFVLKQYDNDRTGYKFVQLYKDKKSKNYPIHKLVAAAFLSETSFPGAVVNHKNGNKHDNSLDNLEYCSSEYNHHHATITGLKPRGSRIASSKLNENTVAAIKRLLAKGFTHNYLAEVFSVSRSTISNISEGKSWKHVDALTGRELTFKPTTNV